ncbi:uncharacterized protein LOC121910184 isoform X1 [Scomber scombrus]|uniref:Uncharacterized protein LOC121910184 isoform X1 n=1 Tax=Scomber scombrus TaxID=13677 RepID=A0AAV1PXX4_SCOSC
MWRYKCQTGRASGLSNKRDTPMKPALTRRDRRDKHSRLIPNKHHEAFPEESEVEEMNIKPTNQVWTQTSIEPVHCKSVLHSSRPAFTENPRDKAVMPATPANKGSNHQVSSGHPAVYMTPDPAAFKVGEMLVKKELNLAATPESVITSSTDSDSTFSSNDDDCYSSSSTTSSSLPSPEIFRKENYVETLTFPIEDDMLGLHLHIKNSTLLDVSHAEGICMHHPPNISTIIDASTILVEKSYELSNHEVIDVEPKTHTDPFQSEKAFKRKKNTKPTIRWPISCKKKVWFKSPIIAECFATKTISETKLTIHNESEPVHWPSAAKQIEPDVDSSRPDEINLKEDSSQRAKFFDFVSDSERDEFFKRERQRFARLRSFSLFPLTAAKHTKP